MVRRGLIVLLMTGLAGLVWPGSAMAARIHVAVASNFAAAMEKLAARFEAAGGHRLVISYGSSGALYAQVRNGAPFQVLLSADAERPRRLDQAGLTVAGSRTTYALGRLVLWSRDPQQVDGTGRVLGEGRFRHLALADPAVAPYGLAARQTLESLGLWEALRSRLVRGENVAQAYRFVASGNAELGFVASAQLGPSPPGSFWEVPPALYRPIRQQAVLLDDDPAAGAFLAFLRGPEARRIIRDSGYGLP